MRRRFDYIVIYVVPVLSLSLYRSRAYSRSDRATFINRWNKIKGIVNKNTT